MTTPPGPRHDRERDREIHQMLQSQDGILPARDGAWEQVLRRARRRKWAKTGLTVAAVVVVLAGAIPAVIGVRSHSSDETLIAATKGRSVTHPTNGSSARSPAPSASLSTPNAPLPTALAGFTPVSASFVSTTDGWLWGHGGDATGLGVIAHTTTGGTSWTRMTAPPVSAGEANQADWGIRFASGTVGYLFGTRLFITRDASRHWQMLTPWPSTDVVVDLEALNHHVWALVRTPGDALALYGTAQSHPAGFKKVGGAGALPASPRAPDASESGTITLNGASVYLTAGGSAVAASADGRTWARPTNPCASGQLASYTPWSDQGLAVVCGTAGTAGYRAESGYELATPTAQWRALPAPTAAGYSVALSAGTPPHVVLRPVGVGSGFATVRPSAGGDLQGRGADISLGFAGFVSPTLVDALAEPGSDTPAFFWSMDGGSTWREYAFGR